jgi:hypothetical protein
VQQGEAHDYIPTSVVFAIHIDLTTVDRITCVSTFFQNQRNSRVTIVIRSHMCFAKSLHLTGPYQPTIPITVLILILILQLQLKHIGL